MADGIVTKLREYAAHTDPVNCVCFGRKSGGVFATGGDDRKLNVWAVGKPDPIMSLSGNTSGVEALRFDAADEVLVSGLGSGSLRVWDLKEAKMVRTFPGHTSNVKCVDFHPQGEFIGSCSLDTTVKVWDIRQKNCVQNYKGHTDAVNCIRFSPDGQWIVSGGDDGLVKLWDLGTGKLLKEFKSHTGPVTWLEFHPNEYLLASASADRTVKFLDLETFQMVSTNGPDASRIRCMTFHPDGIALYSATTETLRCHGWEPGIVLDSINVNWGRVSDMVIPADNTNMLAASLAGNNVTLWSVNLAAVNTDRQRVVERPIATRPATSSSAPAEVPSARVAAAPPPREPSPPARVEPVASKPARLPAAAAAATAAPVAAMQKMRIEPESFLPKAAEAGPIDILESVYSAHGSMITTLSKRLKHVKIVRATWGQSQKRALDQLADLGDVGAMADVFDVLVLKPGLWSLELACGAAPSLETLLRCKQESYALCGCTATTLVVKHFGQLVISNIQAPPKGAADFSREERYERCQTLYSFFVEAKRIVAERSGDNAKVASAMRKLAGVLEEI